MTFNSIFLRLFHSGKLGTHKRGKEVERERSTRKMEPARSNVITLNASDENTFDNAPGSFLELSDDIASQVSSL
jgi:hypothetical protein